MPAPSVARGRRAREPVGGTGLHQHEFDPVSPPRLSAHLWRNGGGGPAGGSREAGRHVLRSARPGRPAAGRTRVPRLRDEQRRLRGPRECTRDDLRAPRLSPSARWNRPGGRARLHHRGLRARHECLHEAQTGRGRGNDRSSFRPPQTSHRPPASTSSSASTLPARPKRARRPTIRRASSSTSRRWCSESGPCARWPSTT